MKTPALTEVASPSLSELAAIPGDTYAVKAELKLLGAVWDKSERIWRIAPDKLAQARALVEHQGLAPVAGAGIELDTLSDPFEQEGDGPRYAMLSEQDGDVYAAKDALKAIGASWDKNNRAWKVREERADYARAIVASVTGDTTKAVSESPPPKTKRMPARKPALVSAVSAVDEKTPLPEPKEPTEDNQAELTPEKAMKNIPETKGHEAEKPLVQNGMMLGGLWRRRGADGKVYLSGWLSDTVEIRIVSNEQRVDENDPSHLMYLIPVDVLVAPNE